MAALQDWTGLELLTKLKALNKVFVKLRLKGYARFRICICKGISLHKAAVGPPAKRGSVAL